MCIDTPGTTFKLRNTSIFGKNKFKTVQRSRRPCPNVVSVVAKTRVCVGHHQMMFRWWAEPRPPPNGSFSGGLKPPPKRHLAVAAVYVSIVTATAEMTFGIGRHITCVLYLLFNLRPKLLSRCVVLGSWSIKSLAAVL